MKVILTKDVLKVGNKYDVLDLKEGYAQNVLLSRGLAVLATPHELAKLQAMKDKMNKTKEEEMKVFDALISKIQGLDIKIKARENGKGHLFKSITVRDILDTLRKDFSIEIPEDYISIPSIKSLGTYEMVLKKGSKTGKCNISITAL